MPSSSLERFFCQRVKLSTLRMYSFSSSSSVIVGVSMTRLPFWL